MKYCNSIGKEGVFIVQQFILLFVLAAGAYYDVREHRIPNWWIVTGTMAGIALSVLKSGEPVSLSVIMREGGGFLLRMLMVIVLSFPLFYCRMMGAGDLKLASLVCGYLGGGFGAAVLGMGLLIGAAWSLFRMAAQRSFRYRFSHLAAYIRRIFHTGQITAYYSPSMDGYASVIPLGVCLFLGTAFLMALRWIM